MENNLLKIQELRAEVASLKNSREFKLGSQLRHTWLFKLIRHIRLKDQAVKVKISGVNNPQSFSAEVWLQGVWYNEYLHGMPLELLERDPSKWHFQSNEANPDLDILYTKDTTSIAIYTLDENLRLDFLSHQNSGIIEVEAQGRSRTIDLFSPQKTVISVFPNRDPIEVTYKDGLPIFDHYTDSAPGTVTALVQSKFSPEELSWISQQNTKPQHLSINHPEWRGVLAAASELFDNVLTIPDNLDPDRALHYAQLFREAGCPSITIQGFPKTYFHLVKAVRKISPTLPIYAIYHGNFLHMREDYDWSSFRSIKELYEAGNLTKIGFVKKGMAEIMLAAGVKSAFIMNIVRRIPTAPSQPLLNAHHVGIWGQPDWSWKKSPYAMLAALLLVPGSEGHVYNVSPRVQQFGQQLSIRADYHFDAVPPNKVLETLAEMHINLYVTLTECAPMLPLESLSVGSPCLFGPTSHYFLDHPYLHQRLVVPYPDNSEVIANFAHRAIEERDEIIRAYQEYAPQYNRRALEALAEFLESPLEAA